MSAEEALKHFGPIMWSTKSHVVRIKEDAEGGLDIYLHKKLGEVEQTPLGYILGSNFLTTKER